MTKKVAETPLMGQYNRFKRQYPDAILLFRVGDFYETFGTDAREASRILGITLTKRSNGAASHIDLAGFPHHALDTYLPKLVQSGKRVAICDQIEDPKLAKNKLVKRAVTELVTPGLTMNDNVLDADTNNFLAALVLEDGKAGVSFLDLSTGEFLTSQGTVDEAEKLLSNFSPKEVLVQRGTEDRVAELIEEPLNLYPLDEWVFTEDYGRGRLVRLFEVQNLKGFGIEQEVLSIIASGVILYYLEATQHSDLKHITTLHKIEENRYAQLDKFTLRNLEILSPMADEGCALIDILDKTNTPMGGRLLKRWLVFPLLNVREIEERQDAVEAFVQSRSITQKLSDLLQGVGDMERLASKVSVARINPREMLQVATGLRYISPITELLKSTGSKSLIGLATVLDPCEELAEKIEKYINPETPVQFGRGNVILSGVNEELDEVRAISKGGKKYLLEMRDRESARTGIPSLKIAFNNVFGYYIEVRNTHKDKVPEDWIRKQTLKQAERYITPELKKYEERILGAEERIMELETELYAELMSYVVGYIRVLQANAATLSQIDVLLSFAEVAERNRYCRPEVKSSDVLEIKDGRHPVIEQMMAPGEEYVANDVYLDTKDQQIIIITGPNMSGKSALLRQTALIVLMAQVGAFVPASAASIGIVDRIFTRVGASDNISRGESTFMVEMTESAAILNRLTDKSLILIDELGRGTSTYDGISIARAIIEYLHEHPRGRAKTLFATHYHELNELEAQYPRIKNFNVSVQESDGKVIFLRKLVPGGSEHSFGIHVAKLAGMPREITGRAEEILRAMEDAAAIMRDGTKIEGMSIQPKPQTQEMPMQLSFFQLDDPLLSSIRDEILDVNIDTLTPLEALNKLASIQRLLNGGTKS
ncbi:MAG: DNA mismatch repair protein MutS [Porphyromonas sp.]|nr:DNA mismatch repair protein MutS [Porphyromonas sp.]